MQETASKMLGRHIQNATIYGCGFYALDTLPELSTQGILLQVSALGFESSVRKRLRARNCEIYFALFPPRITGDSASHEE